MLDNAHPTCSRGKGQLYGSENRLLKHCQGKNDIRHKLVSIYLEKLSNILFPNLPLSRSLKISPKPKLKRTQRVKLKDPTKAEQKVGLKSSNQTVSKGDMKPAPKPLIKSPPKPGPPPPVKLGRKDTLKPGVIGLSPAQLIERPTQLIESDSEKEPESTPENQEAMDMAVDADQATSISEGNRPIPKKKAVLQNLKSLLTTIAHATDVASRDELTNKKTETTKVQMEEKNKFSGIGDPLGLDSESGYSGERDCNRACASERNRDRPTYHQYGNTRHNHKRQNHYDNPYGQNRWNHNYGGNDRYNESPPQGNYARSERIPPLENYQERNDNRKRGNQDLNTDALGASNWGNRRQQNINQQQNPWSNNQQGRRQNGIEQHVPNQQLAAVPAVMPRTRCQNPNLWSSNQQGRRHNAREQHVSNLQLAAVPVVMPRMRLQLIPDVTFPKDIFSGSLLLKKVRFWRKTNDSDPAFHRGFQNSIKSWFALFSSPFVGVGPYTLTQTFIAADGSQNPE